mmetsp:Transcript_13469/g.32530  ORF Transcript_13469/g.32530 Transcript_13469/m.32530 type:complete len:257 (+) Transcript_13469:76-846(+)
MLVLVGLDAPAVVVQPVVLLHGVHQVRPVGLLLVAHADHGGGEGEGDTPGGGVDRAGVLLGWNLAKIGQEAAMPTPSAPLQVHLLPLVIEAVNHGVVSIEQRVPRGLHVAHIPVHHTMESVVPDLPCGSQLPVVIKAQLGLQRHPCWQGLPVVRRGPVRPVSAAEQAMCPALLVQVGPVRTHTVGDAGGFVHGEASVSVRGPDRGLVPHVALHCPVPVGQGHAAVLRLHLQLGLSIEQHPPVEREEIVILMPFVGY